MSVAAGHPQPEVDAAEHPQPSGPGATVRRRPAMPAELVLPALSGLSDQSRRLESTSAYHQVVPKSDEACRPGEPSPAHPAPAPRRHGAYERWLLAQGIQRGGGGGQSVEWFFDNFSHSWFLKHIPMDKAILRHWLQASRWCWWCSTLPRTDDTHPASRQDPRRRASVRSGMDRLLTSSSNRDAFRQSVRCHSLVLTTGLSRMRGDLHVRFLGGGGAARRCCYPTAWHNPRDSGKTALFPPYRLKCTHIGEAGRRH